MRNKKIFGCTRAERACETHGTGPAGHQNFMPRPSLVQGYLLLRNLRLLPHKIKQTREHKGVPILFGLPVYDDYAYIYRIFSTKRKATVRMERLPCELLHKILWYIDQPLDLLRMSCVCSYWRSCIMNDEYFLNRWFSRSLEYSQVSFDASYPYFGVKSYHQFSISPIVLFANWRI